MLIIKKQWIFISIFSVLMVFQSLAQQGKTVSGVVNEQIKTKDGVIELIRPAHLPKGKTISGTIFTEPESAKKNKQKKQLDRLAGLVVKIGGVIIPNNGVFSTHLSDAESVPLQIFSHSGKLIDEIPLELSDPVENIDLNLPKTLRAENIEKINGTFTGNIQDAKVTLNDKPMKVVAGNEKELFFETSDLETGKQKLELEYGDEKATQQVNLVDYILQVGKMNLNRGESTYLDAEVIGLKDLQEPIQLEVKNQSTATISLEGGNEQFIIIQPEEVAESGIWEKRFDVQSIASGSFSIYTNLTIIKSEDAANNDKLQLTMDEDLSLSFIKSTYGEYDLKDVNYSPNNRLLNFENEKVFLLMIYNSEELENQETVWLQLDDKNKKWDKMSENEIMALGTFFIDYCGRFSPPCPPGCKGHSAMWGTGAGIPDDTCIPSDIKR